MGPSPPPATRVARDVAVQLAGRAFNLALGIVVTALVVRTLGQVQFGQWATILSVIAMAEYATSFGVEPTAVRLAAGDPGSEGRWLGTLVSLRAAIALPAMLVTVGILALLSTSDEMLVTSLVLAATMLLSPLSGLRLVFQLRTRNDVPTAVQTLNSVVWGIGVVVLAAADADMVAFALVFLAVAVMTTAVQSVLSLRMLRFEFTASRGRWWELLRVGIPLGLSGLLILSYARLDQVLVFELAGADDAGLYGAAFRFVEQGALLPQAVLTTLLPLMAAAWPADPRGSSGWRRSAPRCSARRPWAGWPSRWRPPSRSSWRCSARSSAMRRTRSCRSPARSCSSAWATWPGTSSSSSDSRSAS